MQRETMRARQLEFLQLTGNPIDMAIMGPKGRAAVLRSVSTTIGLPGEDIVPSDDEIQQQQAQAQQNAAAAGAAGHAQGPPVPPGGPGGGGPPAGGAAPAMRPPPPGNTANLAAPTPQQTPAPGGDSTKAQAPRASTFLQRPRGA
jgi:hypothetical protein